ncbi:glycosyltransferase [Aerococcaceae bacterium WS4759]|uniref:Glycosyltransferase n=1 Tax=Fundicoccus ignavus TaxID=2664442 RepID=A0A6I2GGI6_9LACT|nr:glycosyltransferase family A protein [Fundicoccus ignavus]MRI84621.1 glycosyltransferase [Fundicoccus ignavus]
MNIQIIVSTINNSIENLDKSLLEFENLIVVNQKPNKEDNSVIRKSINNIEWVDIDQKGLSKSRNFGLLQANSELIYLTDDDVILGKDFKEIVISSFLKNNEADILAFQVNGINKKYKNYPEKKLRIGYLKSLKLSSVQLVIKTEFIKKNNLLYDELFGAGSLYKMGEENIFLFDSLKKKANIKYIPLEIAQVYIGDSSWFSGYDEKYFFDRGAIFFRMFGSVAYLYSFIFCFRKKKLYKDNFSLFKAYKRALEGIKHYRIGTRQNSNSCNTKEKL